MLQLSTSKDQLALKQRRLNISRGYSSFMEMNILAK